VNRNWLYLWEYTVNIECDLGIYENRVIKLNVEEFHIIYLMMSRAELVAMRKFSFKNLLEAS
jgi:hypothetical protein